jgi:hypothetical protein
MIQSIYEHPVFSLQTRTQWSNIRMYVKEAPVLQIIYLRHKYITNIKINHMEQVRYSESL